MGTDQLLRAAIFVRRDGGASRKVAECWEHCDQRRYDLGDPPRVVVGEADDWDRVMAMALAGEVDVIVVHDHDDPPPGRVPRWEAVTDAPPPRRDQRRLRRLPPR